MWRGTIISEEKVRILVYYDLTMRILKCENSKSRLQSYDVQESQGGLKEDNLPPGFPVAGSACENSISPRALNK